MSLDWYLFAHADWLGLLALLPLLALLGWRAQRLSSRATALFGSPWIFARARLSRRLLAFLALFCVPIGLGLVILGVAGPRWGRSPELVAGEGRDVVIVLDMSRSMLAQDVLPDRFERARQALMDLSYAVEERGGHRLALIVFAAHPRLVCPLTNDYDHFRLALSELRADDPDPELAALANESVSGTRIGAALRLAVEVPDKHSEGYEDIILISDGDDPAPDEEWKTGAIIARDHGVLVHTVGIGDPNAQSPIPSRDGQPLRYKGRTVLTRLEERPLQEIAQWTGGDYIPAQTRSLPLGKLFRERIDTARKPDERLDALPSLRQPQYAWFFGTGLMFLTLEMLTVPLLATQTRRG
jgi:Ca-activated chloride channel family protein